MQISFVASAAITSGDTDGERGALVVAAAESPALLPAAVRLDKASGGALTRAQKYSRFTGKSGQFLEVLAPSGIKASRLVLVGLGKLTASDRLRLLARGAHERSRTYIWHPYLHRPQSLRPQALTMQSDLVPRRADLVQHDASPDGYM